VHVLTSVLPASAVAESDEQSEASEEAQKRTTPGAAASTSAYISTHPLYTHK